MVQKNVNLWFAKDINGEITLIDTITEQNKHNEYFCPICNSKVIPRTGKQMSWHFAHKDSKKCSSEAMIHWWVKNELVKKGDIFSVIIDGIIVEYECKDILIEQVYQTSYGQYNPDITIITEDNQEIYVEVANTNKKKLKDYADMWMELNNIVVEVDVKDIITGDKINTFDIIDYNKYIFNRDTDKTVKKICKKHKMEYREYIDNLSWVMNDCYKYINGNMDIDDLYNEIELLENRNVILDILRANNTCNNIYKDLEEYTTKLNLDGLKELESQFDIKVESGYNCEVYLKVNSIWKDSKEKDGFQYINIFYYHSKLYNHININKVVELLNKAIAIDNAIYDYENMFEDVLLSYKIVYDRYSYCHDFIIQFTHSLFYMDFEEEVKIFCDCSLGTLKEYINNKVSRVIQKQKDLIYSNKNNIIIKLLERMNKNYKFVKVNKHKKPYYLFVTEWTNKYIEFTINQTNMYMKIYKNKIILEDYDKPIIERKMKVFGKITKKNKEMAFNKITNMFSQKIRNKKYNLET